MFKAALLTGMRYGIRRIIFAGDLVATDQDALNTWLTTWRDEEGRTFMADVRELERIIATFKDWFTDGVDAILGNHDMRLAKKTGGQVTLDDLTKHTGVQLGQYSYMYVWNPTTKNWTYVCHQFNYSKTSVKLAQDVWTVVTAPEGYCQESVGPGIEQGSANLIQGTVPGGRSAKHKAADSPPVSLKTGPKSWSHSPSAVTRFNAPSNAHSPCLFQPSAYPRVHARVS